MSAEVPEFGADPERARRAVDDWAESVARKAERMSAMTDEINTLRITENGPSVTVTVDAQGVLVDVRFAEHTAAGAELSTEFMSVLARAQSRITGRVDELARATDPSSAATISEYYQQRFPATSDSETVSESAPPDDGDFSDESFLT